MFCNPVDYSQQALLSMGFPSQEYWSGLPFPPPGDLPDPGIEPASPALAGGIFTTREALHNCKPSVSTQWSRHECSIPPPPKPTSLPYPVFLPQGTTQWLCCLARTNSTSTFVISLGFLVLNFMVTMAKAEGTLKLHIYSQGPVSTAAFSFSNIFPRQYSHDLVSGESSEGSQLVSASSKVKWANSSNKVQRIPWQSRG